MQIHFKIASLNQKLFNAHFRPSYQILTLPKGKISRIQIMNLFVADKTGLILLKKELYDTFLSIRKFNTFPIEYYLCSASSPLKLEKIRILDAYCKDFRKCFLTECLSQPE